ncbi:uncharacterized protein METZ01_LOCUS85804, partial [marine metagenome]
VHYIDIRGFFVPNISIKQFYFIYTFLPNIFKCLALR